MKALDTNILVRFLVNDDQEQASLVRVRFQAAEASGERFYVTLLTILETIWVLESAYRISNDEIVDAFNDLLCMPILVFEARKVLQDFILSAKVMSFRMDLADLLIGLTAKTAGCDGVLTFDRQAAKSALFELMVS